MPVLDGLDVLSSLVQAHPDLPVIILTGQGVLQDAIGALRRGAWDFLTKPILDYDMLEISVLRALDRSRLLKENQPLPRAPRRRGRAKDRGLPRQRGTPQGHSTSLHEALSSSSTKEGAIAAGPRRASSKQRHGVVHG
jgi:DNA-binding response OmpR family regulator